MLRALVQRETGESKSSQASLRLARLRLCPQFLRLSSIVLLLLSSTSTRKCRADCRSASHYLVEPYSFKLQGPRYSNTAFTLAPHRSQYLARLPSYSQSTVELAPADSRARHTLLTEQSSNKTAHGGDGSSCSERTVRIRPRNPCQNKPVAQQ